MYSIFLSSASKCSFLSDEALEKLFANAKKVFIVRHMGKPNGTHVRTPAQQNAHARNLSWMFAVGQENYLFFSRLQGIATYVLSWHVRMLTIKMLNVEKEVRVSLIAQTPKPPYYAVIFTSRRTDGDNGYGTMAARMVELASAQPGFLGIESAREQIGITVSYWADLESIKA